MRRNQWFLLAGVAALGVVGLAVVGVAVVGEVLSPAWAVVAAVASSALVASCAVAVRYTPSIVGRLVVTPIDRRTEASVAARTTSIGRSLTAQEQAFTRRLSQQSRQTRKDIDSLYSQLEALQSLYRLLDPDRPLPPLRQWAVSPDLALHLLQLVIRGTTRTVLGPAAVRRRFSSRWRSTRWAQVRWSHSSTTPATRRPRSAC